MYRDWKIRVWGLILNSHIYNAKKLCSISYVLETEVFFFKQRSDTGRFI